MPKQQQQKPSYEYALVVLSMTAMMVIIVALTSMLLLDAERSKAPTIFHKTEIIRPIGSYPRIPKFLTTGTYRVRCKSCVTTFGVVQGSQDWTGSAFGIDLSEYGLPEKRYLVTAAHVALQQGGKPSDIFEIQIRTDTVKEWVRCKLLVADKDRDLAVLEAEKDLPVIFKLADDEDVGAPVIVAGCPVGTTPSAAMGFLTSKDPEIRDQQVKCAVWQASAPFYSGNSGGPVLDAETHKVVAVLVAGLRTADGGGMVPNLALCIPCTEIRKLLDKAFVLRDDEKKAEIVPLPEPKTVAPIAKPKVPAPEVLLPEPPPAVKPPAPPAVPPTVK